MSDKANTTAAYKGITTFVCPSDPVGSHTPTRPWGNNSYPANVGVRQGSMGTWAHSRLRPESFPGITQSVTQIGWGQKCMTMSDIIDGSSNTVAFAEWRKGDGSDNQRPDRPNGAIWNINIPVDLWGVGAQGLSDWKQLEDACNGDHPNQASVGPSLKNGFWPWQGYRWSYAYNFVGESSGYTHDAKPNKNSCCWGCWWDTKTFPTASSYHPGGVNILMVDGAVRSINDSIDRNVWKALGSINGGEELSGDQF